MLPCWVAMISSVPDTFSTIRDRMADLSAVQLAIISSLGLYVSFSIFSNLLKHEKLSSVDFCILDKTVP